MLLLRATDESPDLLAACEASMFHVRAPITDDTPARSGHEPGGPELVAVLIRTSRRRRKPPRRMRAAASCVGSALREGRPGRSPRRDWPPRRQAVRHQHADTRTFSERTRGMHCSSSTPLWEKKRYVLRGPESRHARSAECPRAGGSAVLRAVDERHCHCCRKPTSVGNSDRVEWPRSGRLVQRSK